MTHTCRNSKKIVDYDPRFESILSDIGLDSLRDALKLTPDPELITALVERWRPETNTFHLYGGEATITLEDVHFITGLSVDGLPVTSPRLIPSDVDELCAYVESQLGKKPAPSDVLSERIKMTWLRSHFAYREGAISDDDIQTIHQYCRAYIVDFFGSCIFADRSGAYAHLFMLPLLSGTTAEHIGDIGGWLALLQVWALERFPSIALWQAYPKFLKKMGLPTTTVLHSLTWRCPFYIGGELTAHFAVPIMGATGFEVVYDMMNTNPSYRIAELYFEFENEHPLQQGVPGASASMSYGQTSECEESSHSRNTTTSKRSREPIVQPLAPNQDEGNDMPPCPESGDNEESSESEINTDKDAEIHSEPDEMEDGAPEVPITPRPPPGAYTPPECFTQLAPDIGARMVTSNHEYGVDRIPDFHLDGPGFALGQQFESKADAQLALKHYALKNNQMLTTTRSKKADLELKCAGYKHNGCHWRIRLTTDISGMWTVRQLNPFHTCEGSQDNISPKQLDVQVVADAVFHLVKVTPHVRIKQLQAEVKNRFRRQISYKKAWTGKQRAMEQIYGDWEESYNELPTVLKAIQEWNPGTQVDFVTVPVASEKWGTALQFERVFWSFGPSIEGFKHCPPVLIVDGTFITGKYKHTLLIASSFNGNKNIFTVAFGIVSVENQENWEWFFNCIQDLVTDRHGVCVISDKHDGIRHSMDKIRNGWHWRWCIRHYASNYNAKAKCPPMKHRLTALCRSHFTLNYFIFNLSFLTKSRPLCDPSR
ncbi:Serine/threonine-protein phosphatase 7 long form homolog [Linum perenne]